MHRQATRDRKTECVQQIKHQDECHEKVTAIPFANDKPTPATSSSETIQRMSLPQIMATFLKCQAMHTTPSGVWGMRFPYGTCCVGQMQIGVMSKASITSANGMCSSTPLRCLLSSALNEHLRPMRRRKHLRNRVLQQAETSQSKKAWSKTTGARRRICFRIPEMHYGC